MRLHFASSFISWAAWTVCVPLLAQPPCSVQSVVGTWAVSGQGFVFATIGGNPVQLPGADLGLISISYDGRAAANLTGTIAGQSAPIIVDQGTVTINPDCTGTLSSPTQIPGFTLKEEFVVVSNGTEIRTIASSGIQGKPAVWQCRWKRLAHVPLPLFQAGSNCSADRIQGAWAGSFSGVVLLPGVPFPAPTGILLSGTFDFQGGMSGTFTASLGGAVSAGSYTGRITEVKPDCTGTWKWKLKGADGVELPGEGIEKFVILDGGKEIWSLGTQGVLGVPVGLSRLERTAPHQR